MVSKQIANREDPAGNETPSPPGECREFLEGYSEYRDGRLDDGKRSSFLGHMAACSPCRRYDRVIRTGVRVLREPGPAPSRTPLSIAEVRFRATALERESPALGTAGSRATLSAAAAVALFLAAVAWSPFLSGGTPEIEMPPLFAGAPPSASAPAFAPLARLSPPDVRRPD